MTLQLGSITFDCDDTLAVARFWSAVLDKPVDDGASEFFATIGYGGDSGPAWFFGKVPEGTLPQVRSQAWQVKAPL